jgi:short-subunit dehydrogenase
MSRRRWGTALVTGASSGIGAAIARELAAVGTDLTLVGRDRARLEGIAVEQARPWGSTVELVDADLSTADGLAEVVALVLDEDRPVDLVVNAAGAGARGRFWELPLGPQCDLIALNAVALASLTHASLAAMVPRRRGTVVNVGSLAGLRPAPGSAIYGATKSFVALLGDSLVPELAGTGVTLTTVLPGNTDTAFFAHQLGGTGRSAPTRPSRMWSTPEEVARAALRAAARGRARVVPGARWRAVAAAFEVVPTGLQRRLLGAVGTERDRPPR